MKKKKITDYTNENNEHILNVIKDRTRIDEKDYFFGESVVFIAYMLYKLKTEWKDKGEGEFYQLLSEKGFFILHSDVKELLIRRIKWDDFVQTAEYLTEDELLDFIMTYQDTKFNTDPTQFCILELVDKILDIKKNDNVIEYSSEDADFTYYSSEKHPGGDYISCAPNEYMMDVSIAKKDVLGLDGESCWDEFFTDLMDGHDKDKVFVNYKVDTNWQKYAQFDEINEMLQTVCPEYSGKFTSPICLAGIISAVLAEKGRAVMLVNAGQLSGAETEEARRVLVEENCIKGVIALPNKMYLSTWTNVYLLVLENNSKNIRFCDAREIYQKGRLKGKKVNTISSEDIQLIYNDFVKGSDYTQTVKISELRDNNYSLLPHRYVKRNEYEETVSFDSFIDKIERGITLSGKDIDKYVVDGETSDKCITPSCLSNGIIATHKYFNSDNFSKKVNMAYPGDLLINKAGTPFRVAVADDFYVVVGNVYIVRLKGDRKSYYIKGFLESPAGQQEMDKYSAGSIAKIISVLNLKMVQIPIFEDKKMKRIEKDVYEMTTNLQKAINDLKSIGELYV